MFSCLFCFFFFLMIRRPPRSTPFPTRRSSDLLQAYRQSLERDHRPILSAGGQFHAAHRHDFPRGVAEWTQTEEGTDVVFAEYRLRVRRSRQHLAFGRPGGAGGENARQHSPHLFRRCRAVAICSQSRASAGEFCAQRGAQFKAQLSEIAAAVATALWAVGLGRKRPESGTGHRPVATVTEATAFPCSPAHTRPPPPQQNFPLILSAQFCPEC